MASRTYSEGKAYILSSFFLGDVPAPTVFYIGLGTGALIDDENATLSDVPEVDGLGYERIQIDQDDWTLSGDVLISPQLEWTNTSNMDAWAPVDHAFLTLSPSGTPSDGLLIGAADLKNSIIVMPGQTIRIVVRFSL